LKKSKEGYSSHLGYEAEVPRYVKLSFSSSSCGYLTILFVIAVEFFEGASLGWSTTVTACL
jgi:hypothetical protein